VAGGSVPAQPQSLVMLAGRTDDAGHVTCSCSVSRSADEARRDAE
jgi:hypothetical protein